MLPTLSFILLSDFHSYLSKQNWDKKVPFYGSYPVVHLKHVMPGTSNLQKILSTEKSDLTFMHTRASHLTRSGSFQTFVLKPKSGT